jgi:hypothetical protein
MNKPKKCRGPLKHQLTLALVSTLCLIIPLQARCDCSSMYKAADDHMTDTNREWTAASAGLSAVSFLFPMASPVGITLLLVRGGVNVKGISGSLDQGEVEGIMKILDEAKGTPGDSLNGVLNVLLDDYPQITIEDVAQAVRELDDQNKLCPDGSLASLTDLLRMLRASEKALDRWMDPLAGAIMSPSLVKWIESEREKKKSFFYNKD